MYRQAIKLRVKDNRTQGKTKNVMCTDTLSLHEETKTQNQAATVPVVSHVKFYTVFLNI
jgi:hypothetical protein